MNPKVGVWRTPFMLRTPSDESDIEEIVRNNVGPECRVTAGPVWIMVTPQGLRLPGHGWKLHVSSRVAAFPDLVRAIVPALAATGCAFKLARSRSVLATLNDGVSSPASVGKAVTIYPEQDTVGQLGRELAGLLADWTGPRVL